MRRFEKLPVVILCGGLGLRLRSVMSDRPKCLAPIAGRPFLEYLLASLESHGFRQVVLCLGHRAEQVLEFVASRKRGKAEIAHVLENQPLGTAGALKNAQSRIEGGQLLALNGDTILDIDLDQLVRFHQRHKAVATLALCARSNTAERYGTVNLDQKGRVTGFIEKKHGAKPGARGAHLVNGGVYVFNEEIFARIPQPPPSVSLEMEVFPSLIGNGLYGFPYAGYFLDIGIPADYQRAQIELPERFTSC